MKTKLMTLASLAFLVHSQGAHAFPGLQSLTQGPAIKKAVANLACADFSGTWKGTCQLPGFEPSEETLSIRQTGCERLEIGQDRYVVGGVRTQVMDYPVEYARAQAYHSVQTERLDWNADKSALVMKSNVNSGFIGGDPYSANIDIRAAIKREGSRLSIEINAQGTKGSCSYSLQ